MLAVLHKPPHDSSELDGAEQCFPIVAVGQEGQFLLPPGYLVAPDVGSVGDGLSHFVKDGCHHVLCVARHDHVDEDVPEGLDVRFGLGGGALPL